MAAPGFYDDRERAAKAAEDHQKLMWETGDLMAQWEALQAEVDEKSQQLAAVVPGRSALAEGTVTRRGSPVGPGVPAAGPCQRVRTAHASDTRG